MIKRTLLVSSLALLALAPAASAHGPNQRRVVRGLPSTAGEGGAAATGPQDVDVSLFGYGSFVTGLGGSPATRAALGAEGAGLGRLYAFTPFGRAYPRADLAGYEETADPDKDEPASMGVDSNPTGVLNQRHGAVAVDAGGNDLGGSASAAASRRSRCSGVRRSTRRRSPDLPPYGVAVGRRGDVYVTTHSATAGAGEVVRVR
jgi:hypothetical protein